MIQDVHTGARGGGGTPVLPFPHAASRAIREAVGALRDPALRAAALRDPALPPPMAQALRILDDPAFRDAAQALRRLPPSGGEALALRRKLALGLRERYPGAMAASRPSSVAIIIIVTVSGACAAGEDPFPECLKG